MVEYLMTVKENQRNLIQQIKEEKHKPNSVRRVGIPKEEARGKVIGEHLIVQFLAV